MLHTAHADVVLNGHQHNYQRYAPLDPSGTRDQLAGINQYIVGTGGEAFGGSRTYTLQPARAITKKFGYLRLKLASRGWSADFVDTTGTVLDASTGTCRVERSPVVRQEWNASHRV